MVYDATGQEVQKEDWIIMEDLDKMTPNVREVFRRSIVNQKCFNLLENMDKSPYPYDIERVAKVMLNLLDAGTVPLMDANEYKHILK